MGEPRWRPRAPLPCSGRTPCATSCESFVRGVTARACDGKGRHILPAPIATPPREELVDEPQRLIASVSLAPRIAAPVTCLDTKSLRSPPASITPKISPTKSPTFLYSVSLGRATWEFPRRSEDICKNEPRAGEVRRVIWVWCGNLQQRLKVSNGIASNERNLG